MNKKEEKKRILILGGTKNQLPLIESAKKEGYYVIVCDWTADNPGIALADKHYQVSTLDRNAVLSIAEKEGIDGVISNSEPAMQNVAYIAEELGLVGATTLGVETLVSKEKFRNIQRKAGLYTPKHYATNSKELFMQNIKGFKLPFIIKPVESSGSRGTTKINKIDYKKIEKAFDECVKFSRNGKCAIEEFVESSTNYIIDGDIFVYNGEYIWDGLFFNYRNKNLPMVPTTESWPLRLNNKLMEQVKLSIKAIFEKLDICFGEFNIEMYLNKHQEIFIIEINPRQGRM